MTKSLIIHQPKNKHLGLSLGSMSGFILGVIGGAVFDNVPIGMAMGFTIGIIAGAVIDAKRNHG
ncbi:hypothetical protein K8I31_15410 [bacterium]|nr:hypothetical protein [bacterium]